LIDIKEKVRKKFNREWDKLSNSPETNSSNAPTAAASAEVASRTSVVVGLDILPGNIDCDYCAMKDGGIHALQMRLQKARAETSEAREEIKKGRAEIKRLRVRLQKMTVKLGSRKIKNSSSENEEVSDEAGSKAEDGSSSNEVRHRKRRKKAGVRADHISDDSSSKGEIGYGSDYAGDYGDVSPPKLNAVDFSMKGGTCDAVIYSSTFLITREVTF